MSYTRYFLSSKQTKKIISHDTSLPENPSQFIRDAGRQIFSEFLAADLSKSKQLESKPEITVLSNQGKAYFRLKDKPKISPVLKKTPDNPEGVLNKTLEENINKFFDNNTAILSLIKKKNQFVFNPINPNLVLKRKGEDTRLLYRSPVPQISFIKANDKKEFRYFMIQEEYIYCVHPEHEATFIYAKQIPTSPIHPSDLKEDPSRIWSRTDTELMELDEWNTQNKKETLFCSIKEKFLNRDPNRSTIAKFHQVLELKVDKTGKDCSISFIQPSYTIYSEEFEPATKLETKPSRQQHGTPFEALVVDFLERRQKAFDEQQAAIPGEINAAILQYKEEQAEKDLVSIGNIKKKHKELLNDGENSEQMSELVFTQEDLEEAERETQHSESGISTPELHSQSLSQRSSVSSSFVTGTTTPGSSGFSTSASSRQPSPPSDVRSLNSPAFPSTDTTAFSSTLPSTTASRRGSDAKDMDKDIEKMLGFLYDTEQAKAASESIRMMQEVMTQGEQDVSRKAFCGEMKIKLDDFISALPINKPENKQERLNYLNAANTKLETIRLFIAAAIQSGSIIDSSPRPNREKEMVSPAITELPKWLHILVSAAGTLTEALTCKAQPPKPAEVSGRGHKEKNDQALEQERTATSSQQTTSEDVTGQSTPNQISGTPTQELHAQFPSSRQPNIDLSDEKEIERRLSFLYTPKQVKTAIKSIRNMRKALEEGKDDVQRRGFRRTMNENLENFINGLPAEKPNPPQQHQAFLDIANTHLNTIKTFVDTINQIGSSIRPSPRPNPEASELPRWLRILISAALTFVGVLIGAFGVSHGNPWVTGVGTAWTIGGITTCIYTLFNKSKTSEEKMHHHPDASMSRGEPPYITSLLNEGHTLTTTLLPKGKT